MRIRILSRVQIAASDEIYGYDMSGPLLCTLRDFLSLGGSVDLASS